MDLSYHLNESIALDSIIKVQQAILDLIIIISKMKIVESLLGFKEKKTAVLQQRNSILKLLIMINIPNLIILYLFNSQIPEPYMDQQFHYRQFMHYHNNQFHIWDDKITTPPGLYIMQRILTIILPSNLGFLRAINSLVFSNVFIVYVLKIYDFLQASPANLTRSLNLALTPTIYFFNFLDYTDSASISALAAMFYYNLIKSEWRLGLVSLAAMLIRQNNIIWILYLIIYQVLCENKKLIQTPKSLLSHLLSIVKIFLVNKKQILLQSKFPVLAIVTFLAYIRVYNGGRLVFGDHSHHQLTFHPNQLLYLGVFCIINLPITLGQYISSFGIFLQRVYISRHALAAYMFLLSISIILVDKCTLVHRFITDDNRHYTFYIYRYIIKNKYLKYLLCLVYAFSINFIFKQTVNSELKLMKFILWFGASFGYLCFGQLVQFRYFAAPFLFLCFQLQNKDFNLDVQGIHKEQNRYTTREKMIWTLLVKIIINTVIISIFFLYQFDNEFGKGRLMW